MDSIEVRRLLHDIAIVPGCRVLPPSGMPSVGSGLVLPEDLAEVYRRCGGIELYPDAEFGFKIVTPDQFVPANPAIVGESELDDITDDWYVVATGGPGQFITMDLAPARLGRCYDSFWDRHGVAGDCPVVARSFLELLRQMFEGRGTSLFWLNDDFLPLGDAYD